MYGEPSHYSSVQIAQYYDRNTGRFLRYGGSGDSAAIHRQVWAPGVATRQQAFQFTNQLVAQFIRPVIHDGSHVLDVGCGVGGVSLWLAQRMNLNLIGITNSAVQQKIAAQRARDHGLAQRCRFILADFENLPHLDTLDAAFAIESFVHASDANRFFEQLAMLLKAGGRLVLCDDFLAAQPRQTPASAQALKWVERFRQGWHINSLLTVEETVALASQAGFRVLEDQDLSPYVRSLPPPILRLMLGITSLPLRTPYWHNLSGGMALQYCLQQGWTEYHLLALEKIAG